MSVPIFCWEKSFLLKRVMTNQMTIRCRNCRCVVLHAAWMPAYDEYCCVLMRFDIWCCMMKYSRFSYDNGQLKQATFCQHGRQPEVNRVVVDGEWWRQSFSFEITNVKAEWLPLLISNENGWRHHSPSITARFTLCWRPCWQKRLLPKLSVRKI